MNNRPFKKASLPLLLAAAVLIGFVPSVSAQTKIATIDLKKVFDGYFKTKQADGRLKEDASQAEKTLKGMLDDYQKASEDYKKLIESANDQAVSSEEREKRKKSSESKLLELQEIEKQVGQYRRDTTERLETQKRRMRDNILREIREVVNQKAKLAGYSLVMDTAAESINQTSIVLYSNGLGDMTDDILSEINRSAPPGSLNSPAETKEEKSPAATTDKSKAPKK